MRIAGLYKYLTAAAAVGMAALWISGTGGAAQEKWPAPPKLVFQDCVAADRSVQHNSASALGNDFFVITTYEEYDGDGPVIKKKPEPNGSTDCLNVYLVLGVSVAEDNPALLIHDMALIVAQRNTPKDGAAPALRRWIMLDQDGDGHLDKALYAEGTNPKADRIAGSHKIELPSEQLDGLQGYFEEAVRELTQKAADGAGSPCIIS